MSEDATSRSRPQHRIGVYLAIVQFIFTLTWTIYVIFLPQLAAQAGIPKEAIFLILLLDQLVFAFADYAMGLWSDRAASILGKLGYAILSITIVSCLAFLLLPFTAPSGAWWLFLVVTILWTISSSALRAPPLVLIGKHAAQPTVPWLSALSLFGLGLAGAVSPYLAITLRDWDPRIPFVASSIALALATTGIIWAERTLAKEAPPAPAEDASGKPVNPVLWFLAAVLLVGLGFQIHFSLNSAAQYLKLAKADQLPYLMPVFWIGFNVIMLPASIATKRYGGIPIAAIGAIVAAIASFASAKATSLNALIVFQFVAGGAWGCVMMSAVSAAIAIGHTGREGKLTGALFSLLAVAAFTRIALLAAEVNKDPQYAALFAWAPVVCWAVGGGVLLWLAMKHRPETAVAPT